MSQPGDDHLPLTPGPPLAARVDKMLATGRITEEEESRVRAAAEAGGLDAVVLEIRLRHAREWVAAAVEEGRLTQDEADDVLTRLARGEDPRVTRHSRRGRGRS